MRAWKVLIGAALLCIAVQAEAADIKNGDTGYVADNSIWFTSEADLSVWKRVREVFAAKDVETYQAIILKERQAWQFVSGPMKVKVVTYFTDQHEICVKMLEKGRFEGTDWWVDDKNFSKAK